MPLIKIDDKEIEVEKGITVLQAAIAEGIEIPHYCYHPALSIVGSCRMCLVEIEGIQKLQVSCNTSIGELPPERKKDGKYDMIVKTQTEIVKRERENILEFLLLNHPLDCPVCDQAGECFLQDYSYKYGRAHSRFLEEKRVRKNEYLGSNVIINHNRCIMCTRCVRFTREISGTNELFVQARGYNSKISIFEDKSLDNMLAGNVIDICPVGALLSTDYIHKNRFWNLEAKKSICTDCSVGCNILVYSQNNRIFRINARENHSVNGYFICDIGRYGFHRYEDAEKVTSPLVRSDSGFKPISWEGALKEIYEQFSRSKDGEKQQIFGIASPFHTNESLFMFGRLMDNIFKDKSIIGKLPFIEDYEIHFDFGFRISKDRSPNRQGLLDFCPNLEDEILQKVKTGKVRLCYALDDGVDRILDEEWKAFFKSQKFLVVQTYAMTPLAKLAHLILPGPSPMEREGTLTNDQGRIQWVKPSVSLTNKTRPDWEIIMEFMNTVGKRELKYSSVNEVNLEMGERFPSYRETTFFKTGNKGLPKKNITTSQPSEGGQAGDPVK